LTSHSSSSPRRWVRAERVHTARAGGCAFLAPRAVSLLLGLTAVCCESPAHQVGRLDILFAARHPAGGCVPNTRTPPRRAVARYYIRWLCPFFVGQPLAVASRRHTKGASHAIRGMAAAHVQAGRKRPRMRRTGNFNAQNDRVTESLQVCAVRSDFLDSAGRFVALAMKVGVRIRGTSPTLHPVPSALLPIAEHETVTGVAIDHRKPHIVLATQNMHFRSAGRSPRK